MSRLLQYLCGSTLFFLIFGINLTGSFVQNLIHNFKFNGNLNDSKATGVRLTPINVATSSFQTSPNGWTWTQPSSPEGSQPLATNQITDSTNYPMGFRMKFDQTGPANKKTILGLSNYQTVFINS